MSNLDELLKLKELLDLGIITENDFKRKKVELFSNSNIGNNNSDSIKKEEIIIGKYEKECPSCKCIIEKESESCNFCDYDFINKQISEKDNTHIESNSNLKKYISISLVAMVFIFLITIAFIGSSSNNNSEAPQADITKVEKARVDTVKILNDTTSNKITSEKTINSIDYKKNIDSINANIDIEKESNTSIVKNDNPNNIEVDWYIKNGIAVGFSYFDEKPFFQECEYIVKLEHENCENCYSKAEKCFLETFKEFIDKNINPELNKGQQVQFELNRNGKVTIYYANHNVILENELLKILRNLPKITPGKIEGKIVKLSFSLNI